MTGMAIEANTGWYGPLPKPITCPTCDIDILDLPEDADVCPTCGGDGWIIPESTDAESCLGVNL